MTAPNGITYRDWVVGLALGGVLADPDMELRPAELAEYVLIRVEALIAAMAARDAAQR